MGHAVAFCADTEDISGPRTKRGGQYAGFKELVLKEARVRGALRPSQGKRETAASALPGLRICQILTPPTPNIFTSQLTTSAQTCLSQTRNYDSHVKGQLKGGRIYLGSESQRVRQTEHGESWGSRWNKVAQFVAARKQRKGRQKRLGQDILQHCPR